MLRAVADGADIVDWTGLRANIKAKAAEVVAQDFEPGESFRDPLTGETLTVQSMKTEFETLLMALDRPPCTAQRLAELVINPLAHYKKTAVIKFQQALLRSVRVSPSVDLDDEATLAKLMATVSRTGVELDTIDWVDEPIALATPPNESELRDESGLTEHLETAHSPTSD